MLVAGSATFDATTFANLTAGACHGIIDTSGVVWLDGVRFQNNSAPEMLSSHSQGAIYSDDTRFHYFVRRDLHCTRQPVQQMVQPPEVLSFFAPRLAEIAEVRPTDTQAHRSASRKSATSLLPFKLRRSAAPLPKSPSSATLCFFAI